MSNGGYTSYIEGLTVKQPDQYGLYALLPKNEKGKESMSNGDAATHTLKLEVENAEQIAAQLEQLTESELLKSLSEGSRNFLLHSLDRGLLDFAVSTDSSAPGAGDLVMRFGIVRLLELLATALGTFESEFNAGHNDSLSIDSKSNHTRGTE
ncbi:hypothetical protein CA267_001895 [Alteromonas pelagimontana]|uniref:Uncharacterized protein n=1 Tax=Alteromonas pelagimontana TaxID=1858656 RepID=A0A6M4MBW1_9ALTE|nr:hypothetical protein [Alteromonas pelagimontana]QJR79636.1 hypothetical protein CA267_001895 [Alteromonas pelagimontana]